VSTGEPEATESGHVRFGGGASEKDQLNWHLVGGLPYGTPGGPQETRRRPTRSSGRPALLGGVTDPIGGPVAVDLTRADGSRLDQDLLDPAQCWYVHGQPAPAPEGHTGYWADAHVWAVVNRMAATGPRIPVGAATAERPAGALTQMSAGLRRRGPA